MTNNLTGSRSLLAATPAEMNPQMIMHVVIDEIIETIEDNNSTIEQDETNTRDRDARDQQQQEELTLEAKLRKYTCAAGGGALVVLGVILTPIPLVPLGLPTIVAGLHVLGHEFEEAKVVEQRVWEKLQIVNEQINHQLGISNPQQQPQVVPTILTAVKQQPKVLAQMVSV